MEILLSGSSVVDFDAIGEDGISLREKMAGILPAIDESDWDGDGQLVVKFMSIQGDLADRMDVSVKASARTKYNLKHINRDGQLVYNYQNMAGYSTDANTNFRVTNGDIFVFTGIENTSGPEVSDGEKYISVSGGTHLIDVLKWSDYPLTNIRLTQCRPRMPSALPSTVTHLTEIFNHCHQFRSSPAVWDLSNIVAFNRVLRYRNGYFDIHRWNIRPDADTKEFFYQTDLGPYDLSRFCPVRGDSMHKMFFEAFNLTGEPKHDISWWDVSQVNDFSYCFNAFNHSTNYIGNPVSLNGWDMRSAENMDCCFESAKHVPIFDQWDTSNFKNVRRIFFEAMDAAFANRDMSTWSVASVTNAHLMFGRSTFNGSMLNWSFDSLVDGEGVFQESNINNETLGTVRFPVIENARTLLAYMPELNCPIPIMDTGSLKVTHYMFMNSPKFNQPVTSLNTSNVTDFSFMFYRARAFNQHLSQLDFSSAADISYILGDAVSYNQDLSNMVFKRTTYAGNWNSGIDSSKMPFAYYPLFNGT